MALRCLLLLHLALPQLGGKPVYLEQDSAADQLSNRFITLATPDLVIESKKRVALAMVSTMQASTNQFLNAMKQVVSGDPDNNVGLAVKRAVEGLVLRLGFQNRFQCLGQEAQFDGLVVQDAVLNLVEGLDPAAVGVDAAQGGGNDVPCVQTDMRLTGTDVSGSRIREVYRSTDALCQAACVEEAECKYFLYFSQTHYQPWKRGACRLLRRGGDFVPAAGHVSGPKTCDLANGILNLEKQILEFFESTLSQVQRA